MIKTILLLLITNSDLTFVRSHILVMHHPLLQEFGITECSTNYALFEVTVENGFVRQKRLADRSGKIEESGQLTTWDSNPAIFTLQIIFRNEDSSF